MLVRPERLDPLGLEGSAALANIGMGIPDLLGENKIRPGVKGDVGGIVRPREHHKQQEVLELEAAADEDPALQVGGCRLVLGLWMLGNSVVGVTELLGASGRSGARR